MRWYVNKIRAGATIIGGVTVSENSVVAAGSVVTKAYGNGADSYMGSYYS